MNQLYGITSSVSNALISLNTNISNFAQHAFFRNNLETIKTTMSSPSSWLNLSQYFAGPPPTQLGTTNTLITTSGNSVVDSGIKLADSVCKI